MPRMNRVSPQGQFHAVPDRGTLMGNRGILHEGEAIRRPFAHQHWVCCVLSFKDRRRKLMQPGRYTELFFLDEATAYAAGHRPCAECRRADHLEFAGLWAQVHGPARAPQIDRLLHAQRIHRRAQVTWEAEAASLPDGTMIRGPDGPVLIWQGQHDWSFAGYTPRAPLKGAVTVLTPPAIVALYAAGLRPGVHPSVTPRPAT